MRCLVALILAVFIAMLLAPTYVLLDFKIEQDRIERELCVQRDMVETMRTCHGHCELSKRFRQLEEAAEAGVPVERLKQRLEPITPLDPLPGVWGAVGGLRDFQHYAEGLIERPADGVDHVPWG